MQDFPSQQQRSEQQSTEQHSAEQHSVEQVTRSATPLQSPHQPQSQQRQSEQKWPQTLWIVRHGQSAGNVARDLAEAQGVPLIDIATRDADVPLSALGAEQATALGEWFANQAAEDSPSVVLCSPYLRARQTAQIVLDRLDPGGENIPLVIDERLREKEFGILDRYTRAGIQQKYPELSEQRAHVGKFYFRPPGGESWCDVILRLRSIIDTLTRDYRGERVLIVGHQVIVNCFRYLFERMDEEKILAIDRAADIPNCAMTTYTADHTLGKHGKLILKQLNFVAPLLRTGTEITAEPDVPAAPKP